MSQSSHEDNRPSECEVLRSDSLVGGGPVTAARRAVFRSGAVEHVRPIFAGYFSHIPGNHVVYLAGLPPTVLVALNVCHLEHLSKLEGQACFQDGFEVEKCPENDRLEIES